jgi:hypothetical protein
MALNCPVSTHLDIKEVKVCLIETLNDYQKNENQH